MALQRTLTGLALAALIMSSIFITPLWWIFPVIIVLAALVGFFEYSFIAAKVEARPSFATALVFIILLLIDAWFYQLRHFLIIIIGALTIAGVVHIFLRDYKGCIAGMASTMFGGLWVGLPMALALMILKGANGHFILGLLMGVVFLADTGAYIVGSNMGRHKLCPRLSPNKTIEGAVGGLIFSLLAALLCHLILLLVKKPIFTLGEIFFLGIFFGVVGQAGDLVESGIKRDAGVKDSGKTRTGHGGVLDVIDSLLFSIPLMYLYLLFFPR